MNVSKRDWVFQSRSQFQKSDFVSESLDPVSIAKTQSRSSLVAFYDKTAFSVVFFDKLMNLFVLG